MKLPEIQNPSDNVLAKIHSLKSRQGMIAVVEPDTGKYFIRKTLTEALTKAKKAYPV